MNDPGLDEPISNDANDVENLIHDEKDEAEENELAFLEPSRWWLASTAFPLIAGTFGPMASAFSICALVVDWRVHIPPGLAEQNGTPVADPKWLIAINAVQVAMAITSNLFLLMNMAKRVRFSIAQPITIIGWYISSFLLITLIACAAGPLQLEPAASYALNQPYYYAIFAAGLYFMVASLMVITFWGAYSGHYDKEFQLTMSQRTLMLQTISFLVYLLAGAGVYSHVEGWLFLDALYWADFTLLTIGIGDFTPTTHLGRSLLFPFAIGGIIILGLVIGSIRSLVLERGKVKLGARMVEKERRRLLKKLEKKNKASILVPVNSTPKQQPSFSRASTKTSDTNNDGLSERERREREFHLMRQIQERAHSKRRWTSLIISGTAWFLLWFVGAAIFFKTEMTQGWSYFVSLYFAYTSLLTIGYGDFYPVSNSGKPFFVFWSLLAVPSLTILISNMGDTIVKGIADLTLWIGNMTLLPGEHGIRASMKESAKQLMEGKLFTGEVEEVAPGFLGEAHRRAKKGNEDNEDSEKVAKKNDPESAAQRVSGDHATRETKRATRRGGQNDELPTDKRHYHCLLIKEIGRVMQHLNSSPPRKYTFDEWAWYLKLIGENEDSAETHREALRKPNVQEEGPLNVGLEDWKKEGEEKSEEGGRKKLEWSWVGHRSPLMGDKEEAQWVLHRLTKKLEWELRSIRKEEKEEAGKGEIQIHDEDGRHTST